MKKRGHRPIPAGEARIKPGSKEEKEGKKNKKRLPFILPTKKDLPNLGKGQA